VALLWDDQQTSNERRSFIEWYHTFTVANGSVIAGKCCVVETILTCIIMWYASIPIHTHVHLMHANMLFIRLPETGIALFGAFLTHRLIPAFVPLFLSKNLWVTVQLSPNHHLLPINIVLLLAQGIDLNKPREPMVKM
jgi:hypothetical protein